MTSCSHSHPSQQCRSGPQPPRSPEGLQTSGLQPPWSPINSLRSPITATGWITLMSICALPLQTFRRPWWLWPRPALLTGVAVAIGGHRQPDPPRPPWSLLGLQIHILAVHILELYYLINQTTNAVSHNFLQ